MYQEDALLSEPRETNRSLEKLSKKRKVCFKARQEQAQLSRDSTIFFPERACCFFGARRSNFIFSGSHDHFYLFLFSFFYPVVTALDDMEEENCADVARCKDGTLDSYPTKVTPHSRVSNVMPTSRVTLIALSHRF